MSGFKNEKKPIKKENVSEEKKQIKLPAFANSKYALYIRIIVSALLLIINSVSKLSGIPSFIILIIAPLSAAMTYASKPTRRS